MKLSCRVMAATFACLLPLYTTCAQATTVTGSRVDVTLQATVLNSLTTTIAVPAVAFGTVTPGTTNAAPLAQAISVVSAWNLGVGSTVRMYAYFDNAGSAMTGTLTGTLIPTSALTAAVNGGATQTFTSASPFTSGATATTVYSVPITAANAVGTRTDSVALTMNLTGISLMADTYTGTLHLQAQAL